MKPGSVVADIATDQGGCFETSCPTTHSGPTYVEKSVVHYCVANIPRAGAITSTLTLTSTRLPYLVKISEDCKLWNRGCCGRRLRACERPLDSGW